MDAMISRTGQNWNHTSKATQRVDFLLDPDSNLSLIEEVKGKNTAVTAANTRRTKTFMQIRPPEESKGSGETAQFSQQERFKH